MRLRQVQTLTPYVDAIEALGYRGDYGLEELIGTVEVAAPEFAQYLGIPIDQLIAVMNDATQHASALSKSTLDIISNAVYSGSPTCHRSGIRARVAPASHTQRSRLTNTSCRPSGPDEI